MSKPAEVEDFLTEDTEISSQKIVLLSFLSPEKILAQKDNYFFKLFLQNYDLQWRTSKLELWMAQQLQAVNARLETAAGDLDKKDLKEEAKGVRDSLLRVDRFVEEFQQYCRKNLTEISESTIKSEYEDFVFKNSAKMEEEFFKMNEFRTTIRGIKVRGVFSTEAEASVRAKRLQRSDPNFNIYMGAVGKWMAWEPDANKVVDQEYANDQLNSLMKKYRENEDARDSFYNEQKTTRIEAGRATASASASASAVASSEADTDSSPFISVVKDSPVETSKYDAMFSGPADLAIARKMEKSE